MSEKDLTTAATIEYPQDTIDSMAKHLYEAKMHREQHPMAINYQYTSPEVKAQWQAIAIDALNWVVEP